jgi:sugar phosphate isomerase/epimerase
MKFGICNEIFQGWEIDATMAFAREVGYDAVEIAPFTISKYVSNISKERRQEIRYTAEKNQIRISGIHWVLAQAEGMYLNHSDPEIRRRSAKYLCELVEFCSDLGGEVVVVGSPKQRNVLEGATTEQARSWARETFTSSVRRAEDLGITICLEPLAPSETNFINTAAEAIRFVDQFHSRNFKIILDVKAMSSEAKAIPEIIRDSWPHFAYFHANDKNLKGPGFGDVDYKPIATALREVGYEGYISVEVFTFEEGPETIARRSLEYLKQVFQ